MSEKTMFLDLEMRIKVYEERLAILLRKFEQVEERLCELEKRESERQLQSFKTIN